MTRYSSRIALPFNPAPARVMHIDLNSCFASVEQQANPLLRDKPIAVAAYAKDYGCILAPSVEAKLYGVKTGMTVREGRELCPYLIIREPDPDKYRIVHKQIGEILQQYAPDVTSKSIDEFALRFTPEMDDPGLVVPIIKKRIKAEVGDWLRVSAGLSTNWILAKLASGLHKPDGFDIIDQNNYRQVFAPLPLQEFCGINIRNEARLHRAGIFTSLEFYEASIQQLKVAFESILARYWYTRLRGYEIDDVEFARRSYGQSYVLPHPMNYSEWRPILAKLVDKGTYRMRRVGYKSRGVMLYLGYSDHTSWHTSKKGGELMQSAADILSCLLELYTRHAQHKKVKKLAFSCFALEHDMGQLSCLKDLTKENNLVMAMDRVNERWGEYSLTYGSFLGSSGHVRDSIAFGK